VVSAALVHCNIPLTNEIPTKHRLLISISHWNRSVYVAVSAAVLYRNPLSASEILPKHLP
jgi:hypothetical protein